MAIQIRGYYFEGPYKTTDGLLDRSGVYAILTRNWPWSSWTVVDVGESAKVKSRVDTHDRKDCWAMNALMDGLSVAVLYTTKLQKKGRTEIEQSIRQATSPLCGKQ